MNKSEKFSADLKRIKKANRSASYFNLNGALADIERLFTSQNSQAQDLASSLFDWWKNEWARGPELEDLALEKLAALNAFLNQEEDVDALDQDDWKRVKDEVSYEAENLPLDLLSQMMKTIVSKGGID
ncbi:MAG: hypothetical protein IK094_01195 [Treponema sp.]|nr:hypothetical protein [Treponema sp.]